MTYGPVRRAWILRAYSASSSWSSAGQEATCSSNVLVLGFTSLRSRMPGFARQHADVDADLAERLLVFGVGVRSEDQLGICRAMQPAVLIDLVLKLARRPAGVSERE